MLNKGQHYRQINQEGQFTDELLIEVTRVARNHQWADIKVHYGMYEGDHWTKRQPLVEGNFAFSAIEV